MRRATRRAALVLHLTTSVGWLGAAIAFVPLAVIGATSSDETAVRAALVSMPWVVRFVIVPGALGALVTGTLLALGTPWGLFQHYWVVVKWVLTLICAGVLLAQVTPIDALADRAGDPNLDVLALPDRARPLVHALGGIAVLLVIQTLGVLKPRGLTPYGWRTGRGARPSGA